MYTLGMIAHLLKTDLQPLYVQRKLANPEPFIAWAKGQGFPKVLSPEELHVTIVYSKTAVDWRSLYPNELPLKVVGGAREVIPLGDKGAVVLKFQSDELADRHQQWADEGASWDYEGYQSHVTISYNAADVDLTGIKPYTGVLEFGPELYDPINENYTETVVEKVDAQSIAGFAAVLKGAPLGNQNAAGPHKSHNANHDISAEEKTRAVAALSGVSQHTLFGRPHPQTDRTREIVDPAAVGMKPFSTEHNGRFSNDPPDAKDMVVSELDISKLRATQDAVGSKEVREYLTGTGRMGTEVPTVVQNGDDYYVQDGHHRLVAMALAGRTKVKVNLAKIKSVSIEGNQYKATYLPQDSVTKGAPFGNDNAAGPHRGKDHYDIDPGKLSPEQKAALKGHAIKAGTKLAEEMDLKTEAHIDIQAIKGVLAPGGKFYVEVDYPIASLKIGGHVEGQDYAKAVPSKGSILVGPHGEIVDGNHRTAAAKHGGAKTIKAWVPLADALEHLTSTGVGKAEDAQSIAGFGLLFKGAPMGNQNAVGDHAFAPRPGSIGNQRAAGSRSGGKDGGGGSGSTSEEQHNALRTYSESGSNYAASTTNAYLRKGKIVNERNESVEQMDKHIAAIDDAMLASKTTEERVVFRGTGLGEFGLNSHKLDDPQSLVGKVFTDKGYTSTSTDKQMVEDAYSNDGGALLKITVPKGTPHADMNAERGHGKVAHVEGEKEILLPRGSSYRVKAVTVTPGKRSWHPPVTTIEVEHIAHALKNDLSTADIATAGLLAPQPPKKYKRLNLAWLLQANEPVQKGAPLGNQNAAGPHKGYTTKYKSPQEAIDTVSEKGHDLVADGYEEAQFEWSAKGNTEVFNGTYTKPGHPTVKLHYDGDKSVSVTGGGDQPAKPAVEEKPAANTKLSDLETNVVEGYADGEYENYRHINGFLRGKISEAKATADLKDAADDGYGADMPVGHQVKVLDGIMDRTRLHADTTVYRGGAAGTFDKLKVGDSLTDKGYMSTSLSKNYAAGFGVYQSRTGSSHVLELKVPKGTPHINMMKDGGMGHEQEILLPRGSSLKVTGHRKEKVKHGDEHLETTIVTAEYVPPPLKKWSEVFKGAPFGNQNAAGPHKGHDGATSAVHSTYPDKTFDGKAIKTHSVEAVMAGIKELESKGIAVHYSAADFHTATMGRVHPVELVKKIWGEEEYANGQVKNAAILEHKGGGDYEHLKGSVRVLGGVVEGSDDGGTVHGAKINHVERNFLPGMQAVDHTYLKLANEDSANGAVKKMFTHAVPAYKEIGIKEITLHANLEAGAYAWSKYGFAADHPPHVKQMVEEGWANLVKHANEGVPKEYRPKLSKEATNEMNGLRDILDKGGKYAGTALSTFPTPHLDAHFGHAFNKAKDERIPDSIPMTFMKTVMSGKHWTATHRFDDEQSSKQLEDYLTSKPKKAKKP